MQKSISSMLAFVTILAIGGVVLLPSASAALPPLDKPLLTVCQAAQDSLGVDACGSRGIVPGPCDSYTYLSAAWYACACANYVPVNGLLIC